MLGIIRTVVGQLNRRVTGTVQATVPQRGGAVTEDGVTADESSRETVDTQAPPHLYGCPSCERVFVADAKRACATCEVPVERVE